SKNAVIVGGSMAGMVAARVLAGHFERVTIVERDRLPVEPDYRPGVPQAFQAHFLIAKGRLLLEQLFPGLDDTLAAAGAPLVDLVNDGHMHFGAGLMPRGPSDALVRCATRITLECEVRKRVRELPNVHIIENAHAVALHVSANNERIQGVQLDKRIEDASNVPPHLDAELVVDASGRRSRAPEWLTALGYQAPKVINVDGHVSYATRLYEEIPLPRGTRGLWVFSRVPDTPRLGAVFKVEGGRSMVFLGGIGKQHGAPTDDESYLEFARSLIDPIIYEHLRDAKPLSKARGYRQADNQWHQYAALERMPEGFVPLGDGLCAFNPVYGQGMTVAALEALALGDELATGGLDGIALRAQRRFEKIVAPAWMFATGEDYRWATTEGPPAGYQARVSHAYVDHVLDLAMREPKVAARLVEVGQMLRPLSALASPRILLFVLGRVLTGKKPSQWGRSAELRRQDKLTGS
ncbi:MAG: FAD-dependent oxidoreductase, partial [Polyangiales bacterium]